MKIFERLIQTKNTKIKKRPLSAGERLFLDKLAEAGYNYKTNWDFVHSDIKDMPKVKNVITDFLTNTNFDGEKSNLLNNIRVLKNFSFDGMTEVLEIYSRQADDQKWTKMGLAVWMQKYYTDKFFVEIKGLIGEANDKDLRANLYPVLKKSKLEEAEDFLIFRMDSDKVMAQSIINVLGFMHSKKSLTIIKPYLNHKDSWMRDEAKKAIKKIEK